MAKAGANVAILKKSKVLGPFCPGRPGENLPEAYKKFWNEWKVQRPQPVHYIPEKGNWKRDPITGEVKRVQNVPLPGKFPRESEQQLWGGEAVLQGFQKRKPTKQRVPFFWVPQLIQSVVYSEILNKHMSVVVTQRTIDLIHEHKGFDHYILKTPACDLKSNLGIKMKQKLLSSLLKKEIGFEDAKKKERIYQKYGHYLKEYTEEDIEWYGLTYREAIAKYRKRQEKPVEPLKYQYRVNFIQELLDKKGEMPTFEAKKEEKTWLSKINPFAKSS